MFGTRNANFWNAAESNKDILGESLNDAEKYDATYQ